MVAKRMLHNKGTKGKDAPIISKEFYDYVEKHIDEINKAFRYDRDYDITLFGYRTLERAYLKKLIDGSIIQPHHGNARKLGAAVELS